MVRVRVLKPSGLYWLSPRRALGEEFVLDEETATRMAQSRYVEIVGPVGEPPVPPSAPSIADGQSPNRAFKRGKKK